MLLFKIVLLIAFTVWIVAMIPAYQYGNIGRRLLQRDKTVAAVNAELPPLSVIIAAHNQAPALRRHLPAILNQEYARFEVVVIDMDSKDETKDVLERFESQYANLHHTYTPASARDISIERLALTLGFRAASTDWVVITHPDCEPLSSQWLTRIGETIVHPCQGLQNPHVKTPDIVIGTARYHEQRSTWFDYQIGFYRLWNALARYHHVLGGHAAVGADGCNLAIRKSYFMECGGFSTGQDLKAGAEELLVNHLSKASNTALQLAPSAMVIQDRIGSRRLWKQERVFYAETRRHQHHAAFYRFTQAFKLFMPWFVILCLLFPLIGSIAFCLQNPEAETVFLYYLLAAILGLLLLSYIVTKIVCLYKTTRAWGCRSYYLSFLLFELYIPFWHLSARLARRFSARNEFRKKFV